MMDGKKAVEIIKARFDGNVASIKIPLQYGRQITVYFVEGGLKVDDLGNRPFLPWRVFEETVDLMARNGGKAARGDAMKSKLGDEGLPLDSIEGHIAHVVYGKHIGEDVFRRISPIAAILVWAKLCVTGPGELILR